LGGLVLRGVSERGGGQGSDTGLIVYGW
jgi:hypothetical protein